MSDEKLFKPTEDLLVLTKFFAAKLPGDVVLWAEVERETGVEMSDSGKDKARRAVERAGHPAPDPIPGEGLRLASPENSLRGTGRRGRKAWKALWRTAVHATKCLAAYEDEMTPEQARTLRHQQAAVGGLALAAKDTAKHADLMDAAEAEAAERKATEAERVKHAQQDVLRRVGRKPFGDFPTA